MINKEDLQQHHIKAIDSAYNISQDKDQKLNTLKKLIPELINSDNQLNIQALQDFIDIAKTTSNNKGYELSFAGKGIARAKADSETNYELKYEAKQSKQCFIPTNNVVQTEYNSVCTQTNNVQKEHNSFCTNNIIIRGDNLEVLKILKQNYFEKIKMIYIDPPYNTKSDHFIYQDNFKQDEQDLINNFALDEHTIDFLHNVYGTKSHSGWLSFMYPRLKLARDLLKDDGVIFISIDDNEQANLKIICDEIFGEENFIGSIAWESKTKSQNTKDSFNKLQPKVEWILLYTKKDGRRFHLVQKGMKDYPCEDEKGKYREYPLEIMNAGGMRGRESMVYPVKNIAPPQGKQWKLGKEKVKMYEDRGDLFIQDGKIILKMREYDEEQALTEPFWGLFTKDIGTAETAKKELSKVLQNNKHGFETVKPTDLIKRMIFHTTNKDDLILDFFAGSGTTGDAVMQLNNEDKGHRKFILVQWDELIKENTESYKFCIDNKLDPFISSITIERLNRAGNQLKENNKDKLLDIGYKVFSLKKKPKLVQNKQGLFDLAYKRTNTLDKLYNMLCLSAKPLHSQVLTLSQDKLYMIKDNEANQSIFILDELNKQDLDILDKYKHDQIYIDAYANINLESWLNMQVSQKENVVVVY